ncbi:hypothetical protein L596_018259 [Steinernema carpocapsae]|uniref:Uncharacterized protein n=1 Tax=Steinernema carpocapsae TaxID=34508 RepID=A0A4U5N545_STECR|nr:hypothetical protein L596_018259 [Steinernema carpocapsae]
MNTWGELYRPLEKTVAAGAETLKRRSKQPKLLKILRFLSLSLYLPTRQVQKSRAKGAIAVHGAARFDRSLGSAVCGKHLDSCSLRGASKK